MKNYLFSKYVTTVNLSHNVFFKLVFLVKLFKYAFNRYLFFLYSSNKNLFFFYSVSGVFFCDWIYNSFLPFRFFKKCSLGALNYVVFFSEFFFISNIFSSSKRNFLVKSCGTFAQIFFFDYELNLVFLKLPSGVFIYISFFFLAILGRNLGFIKKFGVVGHAGYFFKLKKKKNVRGVAKNPVDHPHGGRTKTNKPEVSPWNWVAKYKH